MNNEHDKNRESLFPIGNEFNFIILILSIRFHHLQIDIDVIEFPEMFEQKKPEKYAIHTPLIDR